MPYSRILNVANISFNAIRENKILMKISGFTAYKYPLKMNPMNEFTGDYYTVQSTRSMEVVFKLSLNGTVRIILTLRLL